MTDDDELEVPDEIDGADVIAFRPIAASTFPRVERQRSKKRKCEHRQFFVDDKERIVECKACGETIDPILALLVICRDWEHIKAEAIAAEHEAARLNDVVEERKKTRAKVSRAREARASCVEVDPDVLKEWRDEEDDENTAKMAQLGRAVAARLDSGATMLLIEVKKKTKEKA